MPRVLGLRVPHTGRCTTGRPERNATSRLYTFAVLERKLVTILFADLVGSTPLASTLDAEQLRELMARYRDAVAAEVRRNGGVMEKFIGDAAMAVFGSPQAHEDDPQRALRAAFAIRDAVAALEARRLSVRIGVETGEVVADPAAGGEFLVTGEPVHLAQRLQAAAQPGQIMVGARAWREAKEQAEFEELSPLQLRGFDMPVSAYAALRLRETPASTPAPAFVGRDFELKLLELLFDRVSAEGRAHLVTLVGPPGIGKTRLSDEFLNRIADRRPPPAVRGGVCKPYGEAHLYCPVGGLITRDMPDEFDQARAETRPDHLVDLLTDQLRRVCAESDLLLAESGRLARVLAFCLRPDCAIDPPPSREELFRAWRLAVAAHAERTAVVLWFDNLQWSTDEPLDFIESLPLKLHEHPVLVIAITRPELLERRPRWGGVIDATSLRLGPLQARETHALVSALLGGAPDPKLLDALAERAEGNPGFVSEFVRALVEDATLAHDERGWRLRVPSGELRVPDSVNAAIATRIDGLPPAEKRLLQLASYAAYSRYFYDAPIRRAGDLTDAEIDAAIEGLLAKGLLEEPSPARRPFSPERADGRRFWFAHVLLREVAHDMVPKAERARLHVLFANWLEEVTDTANRHALEQVIAHHFFEAWTLVRSRGDEDVKLAARALDYALRAAEYATAHCAKREAQTHMDRARRMAEAALPDRVAEVGARLEAVSRIPVDTVSDRT